MIVKIILEPKDIWHGEAILTFQCDSLEQAKEIVQAMIDKDANVTNAVIYDVIAPPVIRGCQMCGNEYKSLNEEGFCSSCYTVWKG